MQLYKKTIKIQIKKQFFDKKNRKLLIFSSNLAYARLLFQNTEKLSVCFDFKFPNRSKMSLATSVLGAPE